jgi:hypothetical protein
MHTMTTPLSCTITSLALLSAPAYAVENPFADTVLSYTPGAGAAPGYTNPAVALGSPERLTGEIFGFTTVVTAFNPPFAPDEIVSIGAGGQLTVAFNTPVTDHPNNLYGVDLLVFGNTGFSDAAYPKGIVDGVFGNDGGIIQVSADGKDWRTIAALQADGPWPTIGFVDSNPYDETPGMIATDFTRPVDPSLTLNHFLGLTNSHVVAKYRGAGGGVGIDIASVGLSQISYVRIINPPDATENIEIDAFSDVSPRSPGDVDLNGMVNIDDLFLLIGAWGPTTPGGPPADFDNNGMVNVDDLFTLIANWNN